MNKKDKAALGKMMVLVVELLKIQRLLYENELKWARRDSWHWGFISGCALVAGIFCIVMLLG